MDVHPTNDFLNRVVVDPISGPNMVHNRPARDHHDDRDNLNDVRFAGTAVPVLGRVLISGALE
jgi:hypothetical protein